MPDNRFPDEFLALIKNIQNKRPRIVAQHILEHGHVTTEELEQLYGYKHPPRAARDLRELGVPLETFRVKNSGGRTIAAYRFGDLAKIRRDRFLGRKVFSKQFKQALLEQSDSRCQICQTQFESGYLQVDHRIPYEVLGESLPTERTIQEYMPLCGECNRAKSWSCEHCPNWLEDKQPEVCLTCYWAKPESYKHVALRQIRRLDLVWDENEIGLYEKLQTKAKSLGFPTPEYVKKLIEQHIDE